jgi:hypothetical protein
MAFFGDVFIGDCGFTLHLQKQPYFPIILGVIAENGKN